MIRTILNTQKIFFSRKIQRIVKSSVKKDLINDSHLSLIEDIDNVKPSIIKSLDRDVNEEHVSLYKKGNSINLIEKRELEEKLESFLQKEELKKGEVTMDKEIIEKLEKEKTYNFLKKTKIFRRSELKELIEDRSIKINKVNTKDFAEIGLDSKLELKINKPQYYPIPKNYKLFIFHKPSKLICDSTDMKKKDRMTIFQFLKLKYKINEQLYCCVN